VTLLNNKKDFRFEAHLEDGSVATLEYRWLKGSMALMHTIVPPVARDQGVGAALVQFVFDHCRAHNLQILPYCSFVAKWLSTHPEYNDVVDRSRGH
jgi:uncharacterized protein